MIRLDDLLSLAARQLEAAGIEDALLESRLLFAHCSGMGRTAQLLHGADSIDAATQQAFLSLITRWFRINSAICAIRIHPRAPSAHFYVN